jgi:hypothetical protein
VRDHSLGMRNAVIGLGDLPKTPALRRSACFWVCGNDSVRIVVSRDLRAIHDCYTVHKYVV